jgi:hypothetical protein
LSPGINGESMREWIHPWNLLMTLSCAIELRFCVQKKKSLMHFFAHPLLILLRS